MVIPLWSLYICDFWGTASHSSDHNLSLYLLSPQELLLLLFPPRDQRLQTLIAQQDVCARQLQQGGQRSGRGCPWRGAG